jgi:GT2 family glycosyltransferase
VIVPSYKNPPYLRLCLKSLTENQDIVPDTEIIVVIDGFGEMYKGFKQEFPTVRFLVFKENQGLQTALNRGVWAAEGQYVLIMNEDNVAGSQWNNIIYKDVNPWTMMSLRQFEPIGEASIFGHPKLFSCGDSIANFDYDKWLKEEIKLREDKIDREYGGSLPYVISKKRYMAVDGWDERFKSAWVADDDFQLKQELLGTKMVRTHKASFFHFSQRSTKRREDDVDGKERAQSFDIEQQAHEYYKAKWGGYITKEPNTNRALISGQERSISLELLY